jgi:hypothetical protein
MDAFERRIEGKLDLLLARQGTGPLKVLLQPLSAK